MWQEHIVGILLAVLTVSFALVAVAVAISAGTDTACATNLFQLDTRLP